MGKPAIPVRKPENKGKMANWKEITMTPAEKEEIIMKLNEIRLGINKKADVDETAAEVRDLINTIIQLLIK